MIDWLGIDVTALVRGLIWLMLGYFGARALSGLARRFAQGRSSAGSQLLLTRLAFYGVFLVGLFSALMAWGLQVDVLLGAAGILSVAVGFASQTSASNLISGVFLLAERSFSVGDTIEVENVSGEVLSIDLLSAKLRTFDNRYVRIPNETLIKSVVTNLSHYPIRRGDAFLRIPFEAEFAEASRIIHDVLYADADLLDEPEPRIWTLGHGDAWIDIRVTFWATRETFLDVKDRVPVALIGALREANIDIPPPTRRQVSASL